MPEPLPHDDDRLIRAFEDHLALERRLSPNTVAAYRTDLRAVATFLGRDRSSLAAATHPLLRRFLAQQHTLGYARASIARRVGAVRTFYRWAKANGVVDEDPSLLLGRPKVVSRLPTVLRPAEAAGLGGGGAAPPAGPVARAQARGGGGGPGGG